MTCSDITWILDNGHGGMLGASYQTKGKRSPEVKPGLGVYEGEFNRSIVKRVMAESVHEGIQCFDLVPEDMNVPLKIRLARVSSIKKTYGKCALISVHANAAGKGWNKANGFVIFHEKSGYWCFESQRLANIASGSAHIFLPEKMSRSRGIKQANFAMIAKPAMPSILLECGFMTNKSDCELLITEDYRAAVARVILETIMDFTYAL